METGYSEGDYDIDTDNKFGYQTLIESAGQISVGDEQRSGLERLEQAAGVP